MRKERNTKMAEIRCIIAGGRDFTNYNALKKALASINFGENTLTIISGTARGADSLGEQYAKENNLKLMRFPAQWDKYGKRAGYLRNEEMCRHCDTVICFWDGKSRGTMHMINIAKQNHKPLAVFNYDGNLREWQK